MRKKTYNKNDRNYKEDRSIAKPKNRGNSNWKFTQFAQFVIIRIRTHRESTGNDCDNCIIIVFIILSFSKNHHQLDSLRLLESLDDGNIQRSQEVLPGFLDRFTCPRSRTSTHNLLNHSVLLYFSP